MQLRNDLRFSRNPCQELKSAEIFRISIIVDLKINIFNKFFAEIGKKISDSVQHAEKKAEDYIPNYDPNKPKFVFDHTGPIHLCDIVKSFDNKMSPDLDGLCLQLIKFIISDINIPLSHIFNLSFDTGVFPEKLKECRTVPIYKAGDTKLCDNYRPFSLVNTLSKILEKIVAIKLTNHLQINDLLYKHQYGFQKGKSTEHNLIHVVNFIANALNNGNFCIGVFLDLKKAFDVCDHGILLKKLKQFGITNKAHDWFSSYLHNRVQKVDINGKISNPETINISVLQGTTLGPILFLCYINDIFHATELATYLFADDTTRLAEHKNLNELITFINTELHKLANWFKSNKMAVNISKTKYIIFRTKGKKIDNTCGKIVFNNNEIGMKNDPNLITELERVFIDNPDAEGRYFKLLGVYLDEFLSFDKHIDYICAKMSRSIYCIKRSVNKLSFKSLKSLYHALVHPHLLYCINIMACSATKNINRITKLQKKAIRIITKSKNDEHTAPLFVSTKILPFDKLILQRKLLFMHSIHNNYAPKSFSDIFIKNNTREIVYELRNSDAYKVPAAQIELFKKFPIYSFPVAWNEVGILGYYNNKITFEIALKEHLFSLL